ncbi:DNA-methyltransferase [Lactobacillus amylovorus]|uniref:DNA-methyltransferase n=1 Tax=Lactobacillus amylovorus TaxID=1604 RepID=UPI00232D3902|nr:site-specific DNA-methyltransferase [Lactobacillus amylovorus]MDB6238256.1 site-specific DNA-methyltransferase [Lactobacillus amylovorus]
MSELKNVAQVKENIAHDYLQKIKGIELGLPEYNDRTRQWRTALLFNNQSLGLVYYDAMTGDLDKGKSTSISILKERLDLIKRKENSKRKTKRKKRDNTYYVSPLKHDLLINDDAAHALRELPANSADLIFTSPPYYNAKTEYSEFLTYDRYLAFIKKIVEEATRVLIPGKFFVIDSSPVLIPRIDRNHSSTRLAVPYDIHKIFMDLGYEFIDDIYWVKPEGAGWSAGRGRRFAADRHPMQYKAVPVTENIMVYRKKSDHLIDWFIKKNPHPEYVEESRIEDPYEVTNIWRINPAKDKRHPAIFPKELAERVIKYYSFKNDYVLDPFGGLATTAKAAIDLNRHFISIELEKKYFDDSLKDLNKDYDMYLNSGKIKVIRN